MPDDVKLWLALDTQTRNLSTSNLLFTPVIFQCLPSKYPSAIIAQFKDCLHYEAFSDPSYTLSFLYVLLRVHNKIVSPIISTFFPSVLEKTYVQTYENLHFKPEVYNSELQLRLQ